MRTSTLTYDRSKGFPLIRSAFAAPNTIDRYDELRRVRNSTIEERTALSCYTCWLTNDQVSGTRHKIHMSYDLT